MTIDVLKCRLDGSQELSQREVPEDYMETEKPGEDETAGNGYVTWEELAGAIEEGVNSIDN